MAAAGSAGEWYASGMPRFKSLLILAAVCAGACGLLLHAQEQFPVGTVVAVVLDDTLDSRLVKPGQRFVGEIAQQVPLPDKRAIRVRSRVFGEVTQVKNGAGLAKLGLRFERLELGKEPVAISARARAVASPLAVGRAVKPTNLATSPSAWTMVQIGDDVVYGVGGPVETEMGEVVGKSVPGGVLVTVSNRPGSICEGMPLSKTPQAIWFFSASACGVYGFGRLSFENGMDASAGEILFTQRNKKEDKPTHLTLPKGTALLLAITGAPGRQ